MSLQSKKTLLFILKLSSSIIIMYFVLSHAGIEKVISLLRQINPLAFACSIFIYLTSQFISTLRWKQLIEYPAGLKRLYSLYLLGSFFNTFLPGLVGGDGVKAYYLYRESGNGIQSMSSVFMDRYIGFACLMTLGLCAFPFGLAYMKGTWMAWLLPLIVVSFVTGSFMVLGLRLGNKYKFLGDFYKYFHNYARRTDTLIKVFALSLIVQVLMMLSLFVISIGMGMKIPALAIIVFFPIIITLSTLPISISGVGVREAAFVLLFGNVGIEADMATAMSFAWFLSISAGGLAGLYEYLRHKEYVPKPL